MGPLPWITHSAVFLVGVLTGLLLTLWEGAQIAKNRGENMDGPAQDSNEDRRRESFSRSQSVIAFILLVSVFLLGLGYQQTMFQRKDAASKDCVREWGQEVTFALDVRSAATDELKEAERARTQAIDRVLLLALSATNADPPMSEEQSRKKFRRVLSEFEEARNNLVKVEASTDRTKRQNQYPELNCP